MYQAFLTEKANFFTEHGYLPEQERQRLWKQRIDKLDEQVLVDQAMSPNMMLDAGSNIGRRLSVPGMYRSFPYQNRLSRSAPPSFCWPPSPDFDDVVVSSPAAWSDSYPRSTLDTNYFSAKGLFNESDAGFTNVLFDMAASPILFQQGNVLSVGSDVQKGLEAAQHFGQSPHQSPTSATAASLEPTHLEYTVFPPGQQDGSVDILLNERSGNSLPSCELTVDSSLSSDMNRENSAVSSTASHPGGIICENVTSTFPFNLSFPSAVNDGDSSPSFVPSSFPLPPSIPAGDCVTFSIDDFPSFHAAPFHFSGEDCLSLPNSTVVDHSQTTTNPVNKSDYAPPSRPQVKPTKSQPDTTSPLHDQVFPAARLLAPKVNVETPISSSYQANGEVMLSLPNGKRKLAIPKSSYIRPKHPKKYCELCTEHPEGFRGEHELKRHIDRAHKTFRKMWICVDISTDGKFLDHCKKCKNGKRYGAYYNAAAHLRRAHFNKRQRGRARGKPSEKRGGVGGGDDPPMETLKQWMKEVEDYNQDNMSDTSTDDEYQSTPMQNENNFDAYTSFDRDELPYEYSSYSLKPRDPTTSVFQRDFAHPRTITVKPFETPQVTHLLPSFENAGQVPPCPNSLDRAFFPTMI